MNRLVKTAFALMTMAGLSLADSAGAEETLVASDEHGGMDGALSPDGERIVASSHRSGAWSLWLYSRSKRTWTRLTDDDGDDTEPQWSPDGRHVVFNSWRGEERDIWMVEVATGRLTRLTGAATGDEEYPAFSPDGEWIVFTAGPWKARNFYLIGSRGGEARPLLKDPGHVGACSFTATSDRLICHTYDRGFGDLIEIERVTGAVTRLTTGDSWHYKPTTGPDGRLVAYTEIGEAGERVRLAKRTDGGLAPTKFDVEGRWPTITADGRSVFFHRHLDLGDEIRLLDTQTGQARSVVTAERRPGRASLSPDGARVAYCSGAARPRSEIRIVDLATGRDDAVPLDAAACFPAWSPDGSRLALTIRGPERWEIATVNAQGLDLRVWTEGRAALRDLNAPLSWSPDGRRIAFATTTKPYESDLMTIDTETGEIEPATTDAWYDEGPQWTPDGRSLVFMSTRGGDWTWGLFARDVETGATETLVTPDYVEKRHPVFDRGGGLYWVETNTCLASSFIVRQTAGGARNMFADEPGARWVDVSADGRFLLFTRTSRRTEFWLADLDPE